jgi:hypothetical protein
MVIFRKSLEHCYNQRLSLFNAMEGQKGDVAAHSRSYIAPWILDPFSASALPNACWRLIEHPPEVPIERPGTATVPVSKGKFRGIWLRFPN